jgi:hypothetical protein
MKMSHLAATVVGGQLEPKLGFCQLESQHNLSTTITANGRESWVIY